ncbi:endonuclease/exonuclease/phosphatase family protein [Agarivorans litoreus]|uniref:endonuclease/exonuclease/phosphatase family protein n=1 Tax=Agarivorans litoreus TaxID=1510455 RepID=UPI001FEA372F|nr:endonuclease/exonuclease/phosphatase family protein [Agarivorans litoreus]
MAVKFSVATANTLNLNRPNLPMYRDRQGWLPNEYDNKLRWLVNQLQTIGADLWGFQELWHADALLDLFQNAGLDSQYQLLVPDGHQGKIACAAAVRNELLVGQAEWISQFPASFKLASEGDDAQTGALDLDINSFSRPVLHFQIKPHADEENVHVYVCHFKSKRPTRIDNEDWYDDAQHKPHRNALGYAISTLRRTAEAVALRMILTEQMKHTDTPVIVLGDLNDGQASNTLNILTEQPRFLLDGDARGGADNALYSAGTMQQYRSQRDVYYTHVHNNQLESLDHILLSEQFYDKSRDRIWAFKGLEVFNDHLNDEHYEQLGATDHGIIKANFVYKPLD